MFAAVLLLTQFDWLDLDQAAAKAQRENKLVLYRQILCACSEKPCAYRELAERPWHSISEESRSLLSRHCVFAVGHVAKPLQNLHDPGGAPEGKHVLSTFFLTPTRQILHSPTACPDGWEIETEVAFARRVRDECYESGGSPRPGAETLFLDLTDEHTMLASRTPRSECGCKLARPGTSGSRKPWTDYNRIAWHTDLEEVKKFAKTSGRLVLFYQIVGDLHRESC